MRYTFSYPKKIKNLRNRIAGVNIAAGERMGKILFSKVSASVRERWFRTGESLRALQTEVKVSRNGETVAVAVLSGSEKDVFGEFGTRSRGRRNPAPHRPKSWRYSNAKGGIRARMMFLIGLEQAKKEARQALRDEAKKI